MHRQTGDLEISRDGVAQRGLPVRHLVLPNRLAGTEGIVDFLSGEVSRDTYLNITAQYYPCHKASQVPGLARRISSAEFQEALSLAYKASLSRLDEFHATASVRRARYDGTYIATIRVFLSKRGDSAR
jgi:putative pyruvate formate lyase activating enzyme